MCEDVCSFGYAEKRAHFSEHVSLRKTVRFVRVSESKQRKYEANLLTTCLRRNYNISKPSFLDENTKSHILNGKQLELLICGELSVHSENNQDKALARIDRHSVTNAHEKW